MISEPIPVKIIDHRDDMIDREPEDSDVWTKIEYIREKEENNRDRISICVNHRCGDNIYHSKNTPNSKHIPPALPALASVITEEEDIGPVEMVALEGDGDNISDSTIKAYTEEFSPVSILTDQHNLGSTIRRISPRINTEDKVLFCSIRYIGIQ